MYNHKIIDVLKTAVNKLQSFKYEESYKYIMDAIKEDPNAPEPHNLLGIWYEFQGNKELARKHYRIAYVLKPTYKPASVNLERVSSIFSGNKIQVDYGLELIEDKKIIM